MQETDQDKILNEITSGEYKYGFTTEVETEFIEKGLNLTSLKGNLFYIIPKSFTYSSNG